VLNTLPNKQRKSPGFTLIELLVVITVIGALSGILLGVINSSGVRAKARDSQRKSDLKRIQTALELYFADFRSYPISDNGSGADTWEQVNSGQTNAIIGALEPSYINPVPMDPQGETAGNVDPCDDVDFQRYNYKSNGSYYYITAIMEITTSAEDSLCSSVAGLCGTLNTATVCYIAQNP